MPETQQKTTHDAELERILAPYDSSEEMTLAQLKGLGASALSLVPSDITKGFAQKLADGELAKIISLGIAEKRRDWRLLHSRMQEEKAFVIPTTPATSLRQIMRGLAHTTLAGNRFWYQGANGAHSVFEDTYTKQDSRVAVCLRSTGPIELSRFVEAVGGREIYEFPRPSERLPTLTPVQAFAMLDSFSPQQKEEWKDTEFSFFVGKTYNGLALFLDAEPGTLENERCWNLREWVLRDDSCVIPPNTYLVFARSLFLGL